MDVGKQIISKIATGDRPHDRLGVIQTFDQCGLSQCVPVSPNKITKNYLRWWPGLRSTMRIEIHELAEAFLL